MDTQGWKGVTMLDILCLFYGVLLGFYVGICKQCNYEYLNNKRYSTQHKAMEHLTVEFNQLNMTGLNYLAGQNIEN